MDTTYLVKRSSTHFIKIKRRINNDDIISSKASCNEYNKELPSSLYSPLKGASKPILSGVLELLLNKLELKKINK